MNKLLDIAPTPLLQRQLLVTDRLSSVISIRKRLEKNLSGVEVDFPEEFGEF
jgi:hypothetical protein